MNIFYIPSWYPSKNAPGAGIFFKEQVLMLAKLYPKNRFIINLWGHEDFALHPGEPGKSVVKFVQRYQEKPYFRDLAKNVWEIYEPRLSWTNKVLSGNIKSLVSAASVNFQKAEGKIGKIDLIHAQVSFPGGYIAWRLAKKFKIPYIVSEHMGPFPFEEYLEDSQLADIIREPLKNADALTAPSPATKKQMEKFGLQNIEVIPNIVDDEFFSLAKTSPHKNFILITLGELSEAKGTGDLLKVIAKLSKKRKNIIFRIGGNNNIRQYQKAAIDLGIEKNVKFLGPFSREKVREEISVADAMILPSHIESFSMVTAEALCSGRPVVATKCGGPEAMVTSQNGFLVKVGAVDDMVEKIQKLIDNKRSYKAAEIRRQFLEKFSKKLTAQKINQLYQKVCAE